MQYDPSDEKHKEIMEYLLSEGAATIEGLDESGEAIYAFDMEVLEEVLPELYQVMQDDMDQVLVGLYLKGLIEVSYDEDLNAQMTISQEGRAALIAEGFELDDSDENDF